MNHAEMKQAVRNHRPATPETMPLFLRTGTPAWKPPQAEPQAIVTTPTQAPEPTTGPRTLGIATLTAGRALPFADPREIALLGAALGVPAPVHMGSNLYGVVAIITPAMARDWLLNRSDCNRNLVESHRERILDDIRTGRWQLHHQGIAFSATGRLMDGHHRLMCIMESGLAVLSAVYLNITDEAQSAIDAQRARRPIDVAALRGEQLSNRDVAVVRRAIMGLKTDHVTWSNTVALERVAERREALDWVAARVGRFAAPIGAAILRAWYWVDHARLNDFCEILTTGTRADGTLTAQDGTAVALRNWLEATAGPRRGAGQKSPNAREAAERIYGKTCRGLEAWLEGHVLTRWPVPTQEIYALPPAGYTPAGR